MNLSALAGNSQLKQQLSHRQAGRGLSHAYILSGPTGSGKHTLAALLAASCVCQATQPDRPCGKCSPCRKAFAGIHPDIIKIFGPEGKPISVDQVRKLRSDAHIRPNEAPQKVYILEQSQRMNASAQNAMLKLLEEGPAYAVFFLLADNGGALLETIRSRCETLVLTPVTPAEGEAYLRARFPNESGGRLGQAALDCQGLLGRAVAGLEDSAGAAVERQALAEQLAAAMERGDELALFKTSMALDKLGREELGDLLDRAAAELGRLMPLSREKRRLLRACDLVRGLRGAVELNANPGQLSGWLCAGLFE